ncbi:hypothetical protein BLA29_006448, partial [Euroglyphus maynei]
FADVHETEQGLIDLLTDFHERKINAFGENITLENMIKVREQQENLARLHFELNSQQSNKQSTIDCLGFSNNNNNNPSMLVNSQPSTPLSLDRRERFQSDSQLSNESMNMNDQHTKKNNGNSSPRIIISSMEESSSPQPSSTPDPMVIFAKPFSKSNMNKLIQNLQNLCESIELLQSKNHNAID